MTSVPTTPTQRSRRSSWRGQLGPMAIPMPSSGYARSHASSRPQSASFYRAALVEVHSALYGRGDREEVLDCLQRCYDADAVFENPFTMVTGRDGIANHFSLMTLLPGEVFDELGEISESEDYDGSRSIVFTHTMHIALLPSLADASLPYNHSFNSFPTTPFEGTPHDSPRSHYHSLPRYGTSTPRDADEAGQRQPKPRVWPLASVVAALKPKTVLSALTTVHLRVITTLRFNEAGRIVHHEDTWGIKEVVEGFVPVVGGLYWLQRKAIGTAASTLARALGLGRPLAIEPPAEEPAMQQAKPAGLAAGLGLVDMDTPAAHGNGHL